MSRIMIDPGHAPVNTNHGPTGYFEFMGMWKLSNFLKAALERCGFDVGLTRSENECPELPTRGECAKGCNLFISEHSNAGGGKGCECYYSVRISDDQGFASDLAAAVSGVLGDTSRGAKTWHSTINPAYDYLTVMGSAVYVGCPHVFLCENGFHDNAEDEAKLKSDDKLREIAEAQAKVICNYLGVTYREDVPSQPAPNPDPAPSEPVVQRPQTQDKRVTTEYRVKTQKHGWLSSVTDLNDFAGYEDSPIIGVAIGVSDGSVKYRVHIKGGNWLAFVTGYDINDYLNGFAGNDQVIDAIEVYYNTPDSIRPFKRAKYRVAPCGRDYYSWQHDTDTDNGQDGYAGMLGRAIGKFQIEIV